VIAVKEKNAECVQRLKLPKKRMLRKHMKREAYE
jgi:hypothetical protein